MHKKFIIGLLLSSILLSSSLFAGGSDDEQNDFSMSYNMDFGSDYMSSMLGLNDTDLVNMNSRMYNIAENELNNNFIQIANNEDEEVILEESAEIFNSIMIDKYNHEKFIILSQNINKQFLNDKLTVIKNYKKFVKTIESVNEEGRINILNATKILHPNYTNIQQNNKEMNNFCNTIDTLRWFKKNEVISLAKLVKQLDPKNKFDTKQYQSIIKSLANLQPERRSFIIDAIKTLQQDNWKIENYYNTIEMVKNFDPQFIEQKDFNIITDASKEIFNLLKSENLDTFHPIAIAFSKIKKEIRAPVIEEIKDLYTYNKKENNWIDIVDIFIDMESDDINAIKDLRKSIDVNNEWSFKDYSSIIQTFKKINKHMHLPIINGIKKIKSWHQDDVWDINIYLNMISTLSLITEEDFLPLIEMSKTLLDPLKNRNGNIYSDIAYALKWIEIKNRNSVIKIAKTFYYMNKNQNESYFCNFIMSFFCILKKEYASICEIVKNLDTTNLWTLKDYAFVIEEFKYVNKNKRPVFIEIIEKNNLNIYENAKNISKIIKNLNMITETERIQYFLDIAKKISNSSKGNINASIALALSKTKEEDRDAIIAASFSFYKNCIDEHYADIISAFAKAEKDDIGAIIELTKEIAHTKNWTYADYAKIIDAFATIEKNDRFAFMDEINLFGYIFKQNGENYFYLLKILHNIKKYLQNDKNYFTKIFTNIPVDLKKEYAVILFFCCIPNDIFEKIKQKNFFLTTIKEDDAQYMFNDLLLSYWNSIKNDIALKEYLVMHWQSIMESDDQELAEKIANFIEKHFKDLDHIENDFIVQLAIKTKILLNDSNHPKSPYVVHGNLLKKRTEQVDFSKLAPWSYFRGQNIDYRVALNPEFFKKLSEIQIDFNSTPKIDPNILRVLLDNINTRIINNQDLKNEIVDTTNLSFNEIYLKTLEGDAYLVSLLNAPSDHKIAAQFKCIIKHILSLDNTNGTITKLSTQEESFLKTLSSIVNCTYGQSGAVVETYAELPYDVKLKTKTGNNFEAALIERSNVESYEASEFLYDILQDIVETLFSGTNALMAEICKVPAYEIENGVHQGLYLRNLIGDLVGSRHEIKFDVSALVYYESLIALSRQEALEIFYRYANAGLDQLASYIQIKINALLHKNARSSIYNGLIFLLKNNNNETTWTLDDEGTPSITKEGAVRVLIAIGAFKENARLFL